MRARKTLTLHHHPSRDKGQFVNFSKIFEGNIFFTTTVTLVTLEVKKNSNTMNLAGFLSISTLCVCRTSVESF